MYPRDPESQRGEPEKPEDWEMDELAQILEAASCNMKEYERV